MGCDCCGESMQSLTHLYVATMPVSLLSTGPPPRPPQRWLLTRRLQDMSLYDVQTAISMDCLAFRCRYCRWILPGLGTATAPGYCLVLLLLLPLLLPLLPPLLLPGLGTATACHRDTKPWPATSCS